MLIAILQFTLLRVLSLLPLNYCPFAYGLSEERFVTLEVLLVCLESLSTAHSL